MVLIVYVVIGSIFLCSKCNSLRYAHSLFLQFLVVLWTRSSVSMSFFRLSSLLLSSFFGSHFVDFSPNLQYPTECTWLGVNIMDISTLLGFESFEIHCYLEALVTWSNNLGTCFVGCICLKIL